MFEGSLAYTGFEVLPPFIAYHVLHITDEEREKILIRFEEYIVNLDNLTPLEFPKLENFDDKMNPL